MRILPRAQREAMFEIYSFCRLVDDIADSRGPRDERRARSSTAGAPISTRSMPGEPPCATAGPGAGRCATSGSSARISSPSSTAWRWTWSPTSARPTVRRSTSIATGSRARSAGCRSGCSAWRRRTASRSRIISAARCSSPISCATSTRTPAIGRLYLPREALRAAGIAATDPATVLSQPGARPGLRAGGRARARAFRRGRRDHGAQPAPRRCARRASWRRSIALILDGLATRGWAPPRTPVRVRALAAVVDRRCATHSSDGRNRSHHRRRALPGLPPRCGSRGAARRSSCTRRPARPAGAAAPITTARSA